MLFLFWWGGAMAGRQQTWMWKDLSQGETGREAGSGPAKPVSNLTPQLFNFLETQLPYLLNEEKNSCLARCLWRWGNILLPPGVGGLGACVVGGGAQQRSPCRPFSQSLCTLSCAHPTGLRLLLRPLAVPPHRISCFPPRLSPFHLIASLRDISSTSQSAPALQFSVVSKLSFESQTLRYKNLRSIPTWGHLTLNRS